MSAEPCSQKPPPGNSPSVRSPVSRGPVVKSARLEIRAKEQTQGHTQQARISDSAPWHSGSKSFKSSTKQTQLNNVLWEQVHGWENYKESKGMIIF